MKRPMLLALAVAAFLAAGLYLQTTAQPTEAAEHDHEVWVTVQGTHEIHVLIPDGSGGLNLVHTIDYTDPDLMVGGEPYVGPALLNPHMILFGLHGQPGSRFGYVSNVSSPNAGTSVIDAATREIVAVFDTGVRTHAVQASPNGKRAVAIAIGTAGKARELCDGTVSVDPDCGQVAEIRTNTVAGRFTVGRTFGLADFANAPGAESLVRFDPICGSFTADSRFFYVTLSSGGLVIFRINEGLGQPLFSVVAIFPPGTDEGQIAPNGCGVGYSVDGTRMFANSGFPPTGASFYYVFDIATHTLIRSEDVSAIIADIHGMMLSPRGDEVIMAGRLSNNFIVVDQQTGDLIEVFDSAPADAPDLTDYSPDGSLLYVSLRGEPVPGPAHPADGETPGVAVFDVDTRGFLTLFPLDGDPHGLAVRRLNSAPPFGPPVGDPPFGPPAGNPPFGPPGQ